MRCYIFDIDGTLSDDSHRVHLVTNGNAKWDEFFELCHLDKPHWHIVDLCKMLQSHSPILFVSGRNAGTRTKTTEWLNRVGLYGDGLYMRDIGDHRPDDEVKSDLLNKILAEGYEPIMAFDDRTRVVEMWRKRGIPCLQVAPGDF